jgi:hypothetical protein
MAVAVLDNPGTDSVANGAASNSFTFTVSAGSNSVLVAMLVMDHTATVTVSSVVWDPTGANQALTLIRSDNNTSGGGGVGALTALYGLVNPTAGASKILKASFSAATPNSYLAAITFTGANQTGGSTTFPNSTGSTGNNTTTSTTSLTVTSATGDAVVALYNAASQNVSSMNGTQVWIDSSSTGAISGGGNELAGAASVTMTATWGGVGPGQFSATATDVTVPSAGGGGGAPLVISLMDM